LYFTTCENETEEKIWDQILLSIRNDLLSDICPNSSSFYKTADGLECSIRKSNGDLIANCYSESDRMGNRRWSFVYSWPDKIGL